MSTGLVRALSELNLASSDGMDAPFPTSSADKTPQEPFTRGRALSSNNTESGKVSDLFQEVRKLLESGDSAGALASAVAMPTRPEQGKWKKKAFSLIVDHHLDKSEVFKAFHALQKLPDAFNGHDEKRNGWIRCIQALINERNYVEARGYAEQTGSYDVCYAYVQHCIEVEQPEEAEKIVPFVLERWPKKSYFIYDIAEKYLKCKPKKNDQAFDLIKKARTGGADDSVRDEYLYKLSCKFRRKQNPKAEEAANCIIDRQLRNDAQAMLGKSSPTTETDSD